MNGVEAMHLAENKIDYVIYSLKEREEISRDIGLTLSFDREISVLERAKVTLYQGLKHENEHNAKMLNATFENIDYMSSKLSQLIEEQEDK